MCYKKLEYEKHLVNDKVYQTEGRKTLNKRKQNRARKITDTMMVFFPYFDRKITCLNRNYKHCLLLSLNVLWYDNVNLQSVKPYGFISFAV